MPFASDFAFHLRDWRALWRLSSLEEQGKGVHKSELTGDV